MASPRRHGAWHRVLGHCRIGAAETPRMDGPAGLTRHGGEDSNALLSYTRKAKPVAKTWRRAWGRRPRLRLPRTQTAAEAVPRPLHRSSALAWLQRQTSHGRCPILGYQEFLDSDHNHRPAGFRRLPYTKTPKPVAKTWRLAWGHHPRLRFPDADWRRSFAPPRWLRSGPPSSPACEEPLAQFGYLATSRQ